MSLSRGREAQPGPRVRLPAGGGGAGPPRPGPARGARRQGAHGGPPPSGGDLN